VKPGPCLLLFAGLASALSPATARAQTAPADLAQASIEQLMEIRVTSAARKSQRVEDVPAAVYVITRHDIRRSGKVTLPEILRLAPGVQVAQVSASRWAISIRGFNDVYSNKLLVLVDGRSVYTRTFSGVFWDMQDLMVADIDRIEVIRGPGGAVWGANAVNGVINVITRPATDTQGLAVDASVGTLARERVGVRYGGIAGNTAYRVFSQWSGYSNAAQLGARPFDDQWHSLTNGARADWARGADAVLAQAHFTANTTRAGWQELRGVVPGSVPITDGVSHASEVSVQTRWTRTRPTGGVLQVQAFHTATRHDEPIIGVREGTSDVDLQYETALGARNAVVYGGGYRHVRVSVDDTFTLQIGPRQTHTANLFFQDEFAVRPDLAVTLGAKVEYDTLGDWSLLPSARAIWTATPRQHVWASLSRTHRTPALTDRDFRVNLGVIEGPGLPVVYGFSGNPAYQSEELLQAEAGYRVRLGHRATVDASFFTGAYRGLSTNEPQAPSLSLTPGPAHLLAGATLANLLDVRTNGAEVSANWTPRTGWELDASYAFLTVDPTVDAASLDPAAATTDGNAPKHEWLLSSTTWLRPGVQVGASVARVSALGRLSIPAYTRVDARLEFRLTPRLTAAVVGQNLASAQHREFSSDFLYLSSGMPRSARVDLRFEF